MRASRRLALSFGLSALLLAGPALAHDFWLEPSSYSPRVGDRIAVRLRVGEGFRGDSLPRSPELIVRFVSLRFSGETEVFGVPGMDPAGVLAITESGLHLVGYESRPTAVTLPGADFEKYLVEEGLERIVRLRAERGESQQEGREKFSRCATTLLEVGQAMDRRVPRALGCSLELRLLLHPADEDSEGALGLRVLFRGRPLSGALVVALQASQPMTVAELFLELSSKETAPGRVRERSDSRGEVTLQLEEAGPWLIKVVHMEPTEGDPDVDWESWWSSLTLAVPSRRSSATTLADSAQ